MTPTESNNPADGDKSQDFVLPPSAYNQTPYMSLLTHAEELKLRARLADAERFAAGWEELAHFWHGRAVELASK